jgi:hypothetical protein
MIRGELLKAGTMEIDGEQLTGVFIEMPKEILAENKIPIYKDVYVMEAVK